MSKHPWDVDINTLVADRQAFSNFVYTPFNQVEEELKRRREDKDLEKKMLELLCNDVPVPLKHRPRAVFFRQLATPNYEAQRFVGMAGLATTIDPLFWEYYDDKFTSNNDWKHSLGKISFYMGSGKKKGQKVEHITIIDFNQYNGEKISQVKTIWGQSLITFHHELFNKTYKVLSEKVFF